MTVISREMLRKILTHYSLSVDLDKLSGVEGFVGEKAIDAAILILIIGYPDGAKVVFTQRSHNVTNHAGQISFPGGRRDRVDKDLIETALRETREEIGVSEKTIDILGRLPTYDVLTGFRITPVVGWTTKRPEYELNFREVTEVFELPLKFLLDPNNHQKHLKTIAGKDREYYSISFEDRYVWGATAGMLVNLYRIIKMQRINENNDCN